MQQKTSRVAVFLIVNALLTLVGCSANPNDPPSSLPKKRFAGVTLRIACPDVLTQRVIAQSAKGWANRCGVNLELNSYDPDKGNPEARADVWVLAAPVLPGRVSKLQALPEEMTAKDGSLQWSGLLDQYGKRLLTWDQRAYAVPLLGEAPVCVYRKDLLTEKKYIERFKTRHGRDLATPATWEEFAVLAEFFQDVRFDDGKRPSLPPLPASSQELDRLFYTVVASFARRGVGIDRGGKEPAREDLFSFHFDHETGKPRIANADFVKGLEMLQRLQAYRPAGSEREPGQAFRSEQAVLCLGDLRLLGSFQESDSPVRNRVGVCLVPGHRIDSMSDNRIPYLGAGAFVLAVPKASSQSEAAFALLEELGSKNGSQQIILEPMWGGGATRLAQLDDDLSSFRLEATQATQLRQTLRRTLQPPVRNPVLVLRVPREREFRVKLTERLRPALEAKTAATEEGARSVLQGVSSDWDNVIGKDGAEHLRAYRLSLGLQ